MSIAWALFIPSCFALNMAPGPNNLLSVNNAARFGFTAACLGTIGRLVAFAGMLGLAGSGLALVLLTSAWLFTAIKLVGAIYLIWIAIRLWIATPVTEPTISRLATKPDLWPLIRQEFCVAAGNPKAILIFTAFLPQFIVTGEPLGHQFMQLGAAFLLMECIAIALYAFAGMRLGRLLAGARAKRLFNRGCAALLGSAGLGLLLSRRPA
ncbi:threonine/homoserine/homoserine lactone efflux protein [Pseudomonas duriflava]|uniref:Threonine/homoserine/homoserine lactone efflux protein n=1 Tax=Pseudomonas duriflava TaxID=459528 RepID=A0A562QFE6_9PSED|nr:LysE family translocator [Pseudomonas duriflava]TWI55475.1 threonine/homoserine/homoserine lactone efflux protein [Pseudomonas duriflava]